MSSTNGELGGDDPTGQSNTPITPATDVEVVDETKYDVLHLKINAEYAFPQNNRGNAFIVHPKNNQQVHVRLFVTKKYAWFELRCTCLQSVGSTKSPFQK